MKSNESLGELDLQDTVPRSHIFHLILSFLARVSYVSGESFYKGLTEHGISLGRHTFEITRHDWEEEESLRIAVLNIRAMKLSVAKLS